MKVFQFNLSPEARRRLARAQYILACKQPEIGFPSPRMTFEWLLALVPFDELEAAVSDPLAKPMDEKTMLYPIKVEMPDGRVFDAFVDNHGKVDNANISGRVANATELAEVAAFVATLAPKQEYLG